MSGRRTAVALVALALLAACTNREAEVNKRPHGGTGVASDVGGVQQVVVRSGVDLRFSPSTIIVHPGRVRIVLVNTAQPGAGPPHDLQAAKVPEERDGKLVITNGKGRLFVQTVLPAANEVKLAKGEELYRVDGENYSPNRTYGPCAECRVEVSPTKAAKEDFFLHVLTATESGVEKVADAKAVVSKGKVTVTVGKVKVTFLTGKVGGTVDVKGKKTAMAGKVMEK